MMTMKRAVCLLGPLVLLLSITSLVAQSDPIGWWTLDETSGTVAADSSSNHYDGQIGSDVVLGAPGVHGSAFVFNGGPNSYVEASNPVAPATTTVTACE